MRQYLLPLGALVKENFADLAPAARAGILKDFTFVPIESAPEAKRTCATDAAEADDPEF